MKKKSFRTSFDSLLGEERTKPKNTSADKEIRATFIVKESVVEKLKAISYWERKTIKTVLDQALNVFIENYEKEKGHIQLPK